MISVSLVSSEQQYTVIEALIDYGLFFAKTATVLVGLGVLLLVLIRSRRSGPLESEHLEVVDLNTRYRDMARQLKRASMPKKDFLRLLSRQGLRDEYRRYKDEFGISDSKPGSSDKDSGELVVILNNGLAPIRSEAAIPIYSTEVQGNLRVYVNLIEMNKPRAKG